MSEATVGLIVLISLSIVCAAAAHAFIRNLVAAAAVAAPVASLLFQIAVTIHLGYMDPFAPIAFVFGAMWAFAVALLVGLPFYLGRQRCAQPRVTEKQDKP